MDLTETEDIKKRWQEYTGELYKKDLHDQDNHNGVITHLERHSLSHGIRLQRRNELYRCESPAGLYMQRI